MNTTTPAPGPAPTILGHKVIAGALNARGPQMRAAPIQSRVPLADAQKAHREVYEPPEWLEGETVWYRPRNARDETLAVLIMRTGKRFVLQTLEGRNLGKVSNVCFYDPSHPAISDPLAAFSEKGTFRKTPFGHLIYDLTRGNPIQVSNAALEARLADIERRFSTVPDATGIVNVQLTINALQQRCSDMAEKLAELTKTPAGRELLDLRKWVEKLQGDVVDIVRQLGGAVAGEDDPPAEDPEPPPPPANGKAK